MVALTVVGAHGSPVQGSINGLNDLNTRTNHHGEDLCAPLPVQLACLLCKGELSFLT